jgi:hypothetical protein
MGTTYEDTEHHAVCGCHLHDTNKDISLVCFFLSFIHSFLQNTEKITWKLKTMIARLS